MPGIVVSAWKFPERALISKYISLVLKLTFKRRQGQGCLGDSVGQGTDS